MSSIKVYVNDYTVDEFGNRCERIIQPFHNPSEKQFLNFCKEARTIGVILGTPDDSCCVVYPPHSVIKIVYKK